MPPLPPTDDTPQRLDLIDALRGFALFGVLTVNLVSYSLYEFLRGPARDALPTAAWDRVIEIGMEALIDSKSITLFSLLFGVGFAMQMERAAHRPGGVRGYVRRLLILLVIGLVHAYLFWWGDILRYYALLGLLLIPLAALPTPMLAGLGLLVAIVLPAVLQPVLPGLLPVQKTSAESAAAALQAFGSDQFAVMLDGNLSRDLRMRVAVWFLPLFVLGRLLIGAAIGRSGALREPQNHRRFWRRLLIASLGIGAATTLFLLLRDHGAFGPGALPWLRSDPGKCLMRVLRNTAPLALGLAYMAGFVMLYARPRWQRALRVLAPVGRMALSHYLAQTLLGLALFYGIGLGIGPRYGLVGVAASAVAIFAAQIAISGWWLRRYRHGPVEWLWRSFSEGRRQPMRRDRHHRVDTVATPSA